MITSLKIAAVVLTVLLTGCAATVQRAPDQQPKIEVSPASSKKIVLVVAASDMAAKSEDWELLRAEWRTAMSAAAATAAIGFDYQDGTAGPVAQAATGVVVKVNDYRYISPGARYGLGVMTGNAYMDADVAFVDLQTGRTVGNRKYTTSSSAWQGIFSAMTGKQVEAICSEIVKEVAQR